MNRNLVEYVGGIEASLKSLDVMRQHKICCGVYQWDMIEVFGKGRASRKVVERNLEALISYNTKTSFSLDELERAVEEELKKHLTTIDESYKVVYNDPTVLPRRLFGKGSSNFWEESPELVLRYTDLDGSTKNVLGCYHFEIGSDIGGKFKLQGFNGCGWSDKVTGWAYV